VLDCGFVCVMCMAMPLCLSCHIVVGFPLVCFSVFPLLFGESSNWLGKEEVNGAP